MALLLTAAFGLVGAHTWRRSGRVAGRWRHEGQLRPEAGDLVRCGGHFTNIFLNLGRGGRYLNLKSATIATSEPKRERRCIATHGHS